MSAYWEEQAPGKRNKQPNTHIKFAVYVAAWCKVSVEGIIHYLVGRNQAVKG